MLFLKELAWNEKQTTSSRTWTRVTDSISYDDNRYRIISKQIKFLI